uniref:Secreted protein n=1 Tax=Ascaris lumbricoides TaxID=6252 RepID=A0A0M3IDJ5_ASCLU
LFGLVFSCVAVQSNTSSAKATAAEKPTASAASWRNSETKRTLLDFIFEVLWQNLHTFICSLTTDLHKWNRFDLPHLQIIKCRTLRDSSHCEDF